MQSNLQKNGNSKNKRTAHLLWDVWKEKIFHLTPSLTILVAGGGLLSTFWELRQTRSQTRMSMLDNINHRVVWGQMANQLTFMTPYVSFSLLLHLTLTTFGLKKTIKKRQAYCG